MPLAEVGRGMDWGEAIRLVRVLATDPSSQLCAAVSEWEGPRTTEWLLLADLFDAFVKANYQRPQAYPRPFLAPGDVKRGRTRLARSDVIALLNRHGHQFDVEV